MKLIEQTWLEEKYYKEKLSLASIARLINCTPTTVLNYIRKYGIQPRTISDALTGRRLSENHKEKVIKNLCRSYSGFTNSRQKALKTTQSNRIGSNHSSETKRKIRDSAIGRIISEETKQKISKAQQGLRVGIKHHYYGKCREEMTGEKNYNWSGGTSSTMRMWRRSSKYKEWRSACYKRDNFSCQLCGNKNVKLNVDHIKPFAIIIKRHNVSSLEEFYNCKELWSLDNGRTLCISCHKQTPTYGYGTRKLLTELLTTGKH